MTRMCPRLVVTRLNLEALEGREVPAGAITAAVTNGKLTVTGDDQGNGLTVLVGANSVILTPDATTTINGQAAGAGVIIQGTATSLTAKLAGGSDNFSIDGNGDFALAAANFDLGDGTNFLHLTTNGRVTLGSLNGKDPAAGGDGKSKAVFSAPWNKIDGGGGLNAFDGLTPTTAPPQYTGLTVVNFLNWTDPNP